MSDLQDICEGSMVFGGFAAHSLYVKKIARFVVPWMSFFLLLSWGWRVRDLFHTIPAYGDLLEILWGIEWYGEHFPGGSTAFYPLVFYPTGWYLAASGFSPAMFISLWPLYKIGGAVFAYNVAVLFSFFLSFAGMYKLAVRYFGSWSAATLASLLFTFWGFRWFRVAGHPSVLLASALLPWMVWTVEKAFRSSTKSVAWFILTGVIWALAVEFSLYFIWIGGVTLVGWCLGRRFAADIDWRMMLKGILVPSLTVVLLSLLLVVVFLQDTQSAAASLFDFSQVNYWGASVNSFPVPFLHHPWLHSVGRLIYKGPADESGVANFGLVAFVCAAFGSIGVLKHKKAWPLLIIAGVGFLLAMGFTLKWDGRELTCGALRPLNTFLWQLGHAVKPKFFTTAEPPASFAEAIPLPSLILAILLPFWEGGRTISRFAFVAALGLFLFVPQVVKGLRSSWLRLILTVLLVVEIVPSPSASVPFPPVPHPAFEWLKEQPLREGEAIVDFYAPRPAFLSLAMGGETLWETQYLGKPNVAGASSVWPAATVSLMEWLAAHRDPFSSSEFVPLLRDDYHVRFIVLRMSGENEQKIFEDALGNREVQLVKCFDPPAGISPWPRPICVLELLPLQFREGWSDRENWGLWAKVHRTDSIGTLNLPHG